MVENGISLKRFDADYSIDKIKSELGIEKDCTVIGTIGRISEEKGHLLALKALKILSLRKSNIGLLFSDKGRLRRQIEFFVKDNGLEGKVKFVDWGAQDFLEIIDLLIVPSKKEGFGYSILEAFIKRIPVIGFSTGGITEIIKDSENGLLFHKYDSISLERAIERVLLDKELRDKIIAGAKRTLTSFSLERMAKDTYAVYQELQSR